MKRTPPTKLPRLLGLGLDHQRAGRLEEARAAYRELLALDPRQPDALYLLAAIELQQSNPDAAVALLVRAIALNPKQPVYHSNLGEAYRRLGRAMEAVLAFQRALELKPDLAEVHYNLGLTHDNSGELDRATDSYTNALELKPALLAARRRLASALWRLSRTDAAVDCLQQGVALHPRDGSLHNDLGVALKDRGDLDGAIAHFKKAAEVQPELPAPTHNVVFLLPFHPGYSPPQILDAARAWSREQLGPLPGPPAFPTAPRAGRRLRIGYVSPDFREHCQALFTVPVLSHHDRERFEVFAYASVKRPDDTTRRLQGLVEHWRDIHALSDGSAAELIRSDGIDVLVDLTMHMAENRLRVFALRPAPAQICWLAYPGTTGLPAMDYRLTDAFLDPEGSSEPYTEKSIRLPDCFWCYDPLTQGVEVGLLPALANGYVTFGCLNNFCKVNAGVLELWAAVLRATPTSRLLLLVPSDAARRETLRILGQHGIAATRVELVSHQPRPEYLKTYQRIDVCLDTVPYNGHTTSLDAFWMGVPVVSLVGSTVVGRAGLCQAHNLKLPELVADRPQAFVKIASDLAADLARLSELRRTLRARLEQSPLMDAPRFARNLEAVFVSVSAAPP